MSRAKSKTFRPRLLAVRLSMIKPRKILRIKSLIVKISSTTPNKKGIDSKSRYVLNESKRRKSGSRLHNSKSLKLRIALPNYY